jgi:hypothetical protein
MKRLGRIIAAAAVVALLAGSLPQTSAATLAYGYKAQIGLGSQVFTPTTATALTVPPGTKHVMFSVRFAGAIVTDDGSTPSMTNGLYIPPGTLFRIENDPAEIAALQFITSDDVGGPATVNVSYSGDR